MRRSKALKIILLVVVCVLLFPHIFQGAAVRVVKVGFHRYMQPFQYVNEAGEYTGLHIELFRHMAEKKGWAVEFVPYNNNTECLAALDDGEIDLVLGHRVGDPLAKRVSFSDELSTGSICIVKLTDDSKYSDEETHRSMSIASVEFGTVNFNVLYQLGIKSYMVCSSQDQVYDALTEGMLDVAVGVEEMLMYRLQQENILDVYEVQQHYIAPVSYAILTKAGDIELLSAVNAGIADLRTSGMYEEIYDDWVMDYEVLQFEQTMQLILIIGGSVAILVLIAIGASWQINRYLKRKVEEKTRELHDVNLQLEKQMVQLQDENQLRNWIINNSPSGIIMFNEEGTIFISNWASHKLARFPAPLSEDSIWEVEIFSSILKRLCPDKDISRLENIKTPEFYETNERGKKECFRYNLYRLPVSMKDGGIMMTVTDITREEQERQTTFEREKNRQMTSLVAGIAHEIRNPLTTIRTAASLIINNGDDPEVQESFKKHIPGEIERISELVNGLMNYARPVKGNPAVFSASDMLEDCLGLLHMSMKRSKGILIFEIEPDLFMYGRRDQLKQCMTNLFLNAAEALERRAIMENGAGKRLHLTVQAYRQEGQIIIIVEDEGNGMSQNELDHCIEPFFTTKQAGTGLGLALTMQFTQDNGGVFAIESEEGKGTKVTLKFPEVKK